MSLRIGLRQVDQEYFSKSGRLRGKFGLYLERIGYCPPNSIFLPLDTLNVSLLDALGTRLDFILEPLSFLDLELNITTGPIYRTTECIIASEKLSETIQETQKFSSVFEEFKPDAWIIITLATFIMFSLLPLFTRKSPIEVLKNSLELLLFGNIGSIPSRTSSKFFIASILMWIFLAKTVLLGYVQTGLTTVERGKNVETLSDLVEKNMSLISFHRRSTCPYLMKIIAHASRETSQILKAIRKEKKDYSLVYSSKFEIPESLRFKMAEITSTSTFLNSQARRCLEAFSENYVPHLHRSQKPLVTQLINQFYHRELDTQKLGNLKNWGYAKLESGLDKIINRAALKAFELAMGEKFSISCMEKDQDQGPIPFNALEIEFFAECFWLIFFVNLAASLVFFSELYKG